MSNFNQLDRLYKEILSVIEKDEMSIFDKFVVISDVKDLYYQKTIAKNHKEIHKSAEKIINEKFNNLVGEKNER